MKKQLFLLVLTVFILSCGSPAKVIIDGVENTTYRPPGTVKIQDNVYVDQFELSNIDWREYLGWLETVYGKSSLVYKDAYPDLAVWRAANGYLKGFEKDYFTNPVYNEFPLVGVSLEQAKNYTKWRTDRVAEMILVQEKHIKSPEVLTEATHFTIAKYLSGTYQGILKQEKRQLLPVYKIPTKLEWNNYVYTDVAQLVNEDKELKQNQKLIKKGRSLYNLKQNEQPQEMGPMLRFGFGESKNGLSHVLGNVSEMTLSEEVIGGNWQHSLSNLLENDAQQLIGPNYYTGFRNICTWEKFETS